MFLVLSEPYLDHKWKQDHNNYQLLLNNNA